jgi:hypothetical protein
MNHMIDGRRNLHTASLSQQRHARFARQLLPLIILTLLGGCSSGPQTMLIFSSTQTDREYSQQFNKAYYGKTPSGEYDVILLADGIKAVESSSAGPLKPSPTAPLSQTLYIHVRWSPEQGTKPDTPTAINAVIDWYIHSNEASEQNDRLHYRGAGFAKVSESKGIARIDIANVHVDLVESSGRLQDPLGPSTLSGSVFALRNDDLVATTINTMHAQAAQPGDHQGPPPRTPQP